MGDHGEPLLIVDCQICRHSLSACHLYRTIRRAPPQLQEQIHLNSNFNFMFIRWYIIKMLSTYAYLIFSCKSSQWIIGEGLVRYDGSYLYTISTPSPIKKMGSLPMGPTKHLERIRTQSIYLSIGINVRFAAMMAGVGDGLLWHIGGHSRAWKQPVTKRTRDQKKVSPLSKL